MRHLIREDRQGPVATVGIGLLSAAWAFAGWRNLPRLAHPSSAAAGLIIAVSLYVAFRIGQRSVTRSAVARAVAIAAPGAACASTSSSTAQVAVIVHPELGAQRAGRVFGLEDAPWMVAAHRAVELDETEALDTALEDVLEERETT